MGTSSLILDAGGFGPISLSGGDFSVTSLFGVTFAVAIPDHVGMTEHDVVRAGSTID